MAVSGDRRRLWRKRGEGQLVLIVSEDFRTCVPLSRYKPPTNASHTHRPHSLSDAAAGLAAHYFQDVAPEHPLAAVCASVCVSTGVLSNSVSAVKSASVCVSASPKPDRAPVVRCENERLWPSDLDGRHMQSTQQPISQLQSRLDRPA